jgi:hypothetical protein
MNVQSWTMVEICCKTVRNRAHALSISEYFCMSVGERDNFSISAHMLECAMEHTMTSGPFHSQGLAGSPWAIRVRKTFKMSLANSISA